MQKTKLAIATTAIVGLSGLACQGVMAETSTTSATADLVSDIVVTAVQPMQFGNLLNGLSGTASETVSFNAAGTGLTSGTDVTLVDGNVQPAKFNLTTDTDAATGQNITVQATALGHSTATASLPWRALDADYTTKSLATSQTTGGALTGTITSATVPTTGESLTAYGDIEVEAGDPTGTYTGTVTVTANRQ